MWQALQDGWQPPDIVSESEYMSMKDFPGMYPKHLVGFVGYACSYAAKWFGGYARTSSTGASTRNYCAETKRSVLRQVPQIRNVFFRCLPYSILNTQNSVIYCDPPYAGTTKYATGHFDHNIFWEWCRVQSKKNTVLVSEYNAPEDFKSIWKSTIISSLSKETGDKYGTERLFIYGKS